MQNKPLIDCLICGKPIKRRDKVRLASVEGDGRIRYIHENCTEQRLAKQKS